MWTKEPVRALGTFIFYNVKENNKKNVEVKIDNLIQNFISGGHTIFLYSASVLLLNA